jgi:hypothetical protein
LNVWTGLSDGGQKARDHVVSRRRPQHRLRWPRRVNDGTNLV